MTLRAKMAMPDLQWYPWKVFLIKYELDIFVYFKLFNLICGFSAKVICAFLFYKKQWRNKHFSSQKNDGFFHILMRLGFKGSVVNRALSSMHRGSLKHYTCSSFNKVYFLVKYRSTFNIWLINKYLIIV